MAQQFNFDPMGMMKDWQMPNFDSEILNNSQRKNAEAFNNTLRSGLETMRTLSQMQAQFASHWMETLRHASQQMAAPGKIEDKMNQGTEIVKQNMHNAMNYLKQASAAVADTSYKALDTMTNRLSESLDETVVALRKAQPAAARNK